MRNSRGWLLRCCAVLALALAGCAGAPAGPEQPGSGGSSPDPVVVGPDTELAAWTTILQEGDEAPQLCLGGQLDSYPPQCGGLDVVGLSWDDVVDAETASGTTWGSGWVVGTYDADAGTFTLTRPVSTDVPDGVTPPEPLDQGFPEVCDDPYRGGEADFDASSPEAMMAQEDLVAAASALEGYITLYVSDGSSAFNVLVQGDPEAAHAALRQVWAGWLCVAQSDGATEADLMAAQQALTDADLEDTILGVGGSMGTLDVTVVVADEPTWSAVLDAVSPWLGPDQVSVTGTLVPVTSG